MRLPKQRLWVFAALLYVGAWGVFAQDNPPIVNETTSLTLEADTPIEVQIEGISGDVVRVVAGGGAEIDTTLTLLQGDDVIAYADDNFVGGEIVRDAQLFIRWQEDGVYRFFVDSFNGVSEGEIVLEIERFGDDLQLSDNEPIRTTLVEGASLRVLYTSETAQAVVITVRDLSATLDPMVSVFDGNGQLLASGDDNTATEGILNTLDTELRLELPIGEIVIEVNDFLGRGGNVEIVVTSPS